MIYAGVRRASILIIVTYYGFVAAVAAEET
jgi:hypothetical protein